MLRRMVLVVLVLVFAGFAFPACGSDNTPRKKQEIKTALKGQRYRTQRSSKEQKTIVRLEAAAQDAQAPEISNPASKNRKKADFERQMAEAEKNLEQTLGSMFRLGNNGNNKR